MDREPTGWYEDKDPRYQMVDVRDRLYATADVGWVILEPASAVTQEFTKYLESGITQEFTKYLEDAIDIAAAEANAPNWDGYGAAPVSPQTVQRAHAFARSIPITPLFPDVVPHPDGDIAFEWLVGPDCVLTVTIGPSDLIHHASLIGRAQNHGKEEFSNVLPHSIRLQLDRVLQRYGPPQEVDDN